MVVRRFIESYRDSLEGIYRINRDYFNRIEGFSLEGAVKIAIVNAIVPGTVALALFPQTAQGDAALAMFITPILWALWVGMLAHGLVVALGGEGVEETLKLYLLMTGFYLTLWIPVVNIVVLFLGAVSTERGLEEVHGLGFREALAVTFAAPLLAVLLFAPLVM